jgi:hypothetical protein
MLKIDNSSSAKSKLMTIMELNRRRTLKKQLRYIKSKIKKGNRIKFNRNFCQATILGNPQSLKFESYERFFYCVAYRSDYKKKYGARTEAIKKRHIEERHVSSA